MNAAAGINIMEEKGRENISDADLDMSLKPGYRTYANYLERAQAIYDRTRTAFFSLKASDRALLAAAERWERAAVTLMRWVESFFYTCDGTDDDRRQALEIMDRVSKDSAARSSNISRYYDLLEQTQPDKIDELMEAEKADLHHLNVLDRMLNTQSGFIKRLEMGEAGWTREQEMEYEASKKVRKTYARIPEGHTYRPATPYPPERIPEDEPVPDMPEPIKRVKALDLDDKVYDTELDEFIARPGYVSEDGLIDDKSMVFHPETHEIEFGYVGGVRSRWKYWKPENDRDVPDPNSWAMQFLKRYYDTYIREPEYKLLEPWPYEREEPEYNKIPVGNNDE